MQPCTRIYYSSVLFIAQHVSSDTPLIVGSSKTVNATTNVGKTRGCNYSFWVPDVELCAAGNML